MSVSKEQFKEKMATKYEIAESTAISGQGTFTRPRHVRGGSMATQIIEQPQDQNTEFSHESLNAETINEILKAYYELQKTVDEGPLQFDLTENDSDDDVTAQTENPVDALLLESIPQKREAVTRPQSKIIVTDALVELLKQKETSEEKKKKIQNILLELQHIKKQNDKIKLKDTVKEIIYLQDSLIKSEQKRTGDPQKRAIAKSVVSGAIGEGISLHNLDKRIPKEVLNSKNNDALKLFMFLSALVGSGTALRAFTKKKSKNVKKNRNL